MTLKSILRREGSSVRVSVIKLFPKLDTLVLAGSTYAAEAI